MPLKLVPPRVGKTPYWYVRGTYLGILVDKSTKATERRVAKLVLDKVKDEIERGQFARPEEPTFLSAAVAYMEAGGEKRFVKPLLSHFKERALSSIDQAAIDEAAVMLYPSATPATRNRQVYTVVSAILKRAGIKGNLQRPIGSQGRVKTDWLWPEQAFRLFDAADKIDEELGVLLRLLCYTGLRLSEALNMRCSDVKLADGFVFVGHTKNNEPRSVFLPTGVVSAIRAHPRGHARGAERLFRFTKSGRLYHLLAAARQDAGDEVAFVTFHTFRHTWATWMRRYGGLDTRGLVGTGAWRDPKSAARYEHVVVSEEAGRAALLPVKETGS